MDLASAYLLRGERVGIREPSPADREAYFDLRRASEDFHRSWEPTPHLDVDPYSSASFEAFLADEGELPRRVRLFVCRRSDDALLGLVNINEIVRGCFQSAYLGYWVGAPHARQGYMGEGLALAVRYAFEHLGLHRLEANVRPENEASIALVRSLGFRREGFSPRYLKIAGAWCDHERWALLADESPGAQ